MDNEIKGTGNSINYKYRIHDPRLGRFLSIDPLVAKYPLNSPYAFSENRVIDAVELEGLEAARLVLPKNMPQAEVDEVYRTMQEMSGEILTSIIEVTDVEDVVILATWAIPGVDATGVKMKGANGWDKGFATSGLFIPVVSGSSIKNVLKGFYRILDASNVGMKNADAFFKLKGVKNFD